jgi:hypothetical protein
VKVADFYERFNNVPVDERENYVWYLTPEEWDFVHTQIQTMPMSDEERKWRATLPPMLLGRPVVVKEDM